MFMCSIWRNIIILLYLYLLANTVNCHYGGHLLGNSSSCSRPNGVKPRLSHEGLNC